MNSPRPSPSSACRWVLAALIAMTPLCAHAVKTAATSKEAASAPAATQPIPHVEKHVLPNGLTVLLCPDRSAPVTSAQAWVKTGSIHEGKWLGAGLSHILEHMLFKGTEKRKVADIARQVEALGGSINAYTTWERTVYHIDIPAEGDQAGSSRGTELAVDILADVMMNATLPADEYAREQEVILREMAMNRDNPDRQASELFFSTVYAEHPVRHPVIGYEDIYRALKREDVLDYYRARYAPNNLVFAVAGDIDTAKVLAQIEGLMGDWKRRPLPPSCIPEEPEQVTRRQVVEETRTEAEQTRIHLGYATCDFRHPDSAPLEVLAIIAGNGMSSRLYQALREEKKLVHEVDAWSYTPSWRGVLASSALVDPDKAAAARAAILDELEKFKARPVSADEIEKALKMALSHHLSSRKTMSGLAGELASNEVLTGDLEFSDKYMALLRSVTAADVQRVARKYLVPERLSEVTLHPKGLLRQKAAVLEKAEGRPVKKEVLPNGLTLLTKEDPRLPFVEIRLVMKSGLLFEAPRNNGISQLTAKLLLKGTARRSAEQIAREIESVGGSISPYSGKNSMGVLMEVMRDDLGLALDVLGDVVRGSRFAEDSLAREKEAQCAEIRQEREQPVRVAMINAQARLFGPHPYGMPNLGTEAGVNALTREDVCAFWKRIAVPSNMVLAVYGDVSAAEVRRLADHALGKLPKAGPVGAKNPPAAFGKADRVTESKDKEQAVLVLAYPGIDLRSPDRAPLELMNAALSGMGSRLFLRLRDQMALCYYVGAGEQVGVEPGFIYFYIGTKPTSAEEAEREIVSEIDKLRKDGLTAEELERARNGLLGERVMQRQNLGELALVQALDELYGLGFDHGDRLEAAYRAARAEDIRAVAEKYLGQPCVVSVVLPSKKDGAKARKAPGARE